MHTDAPGHLWQTLRRSALRPTAFTHRQPGGQHSTCAASRPGADQWFAPIMRALQLLQVEIKLLCGAHGPATGATPPSLGLACKPSSSRAQTWQIRCSRSHRSTPSAMLATPTVKVRAAAAAQRRGRPRPQPASALLSAHHPLLPQELVLLGGGHSHVEVLRNWGMRPVAGVRLTLITRDMHTPYSCVPGATAKAEAAGAVCKAPAAAAAAARSVLCCAPDAATPAAAASRLLRPRPPHTTSGMLPGYVSGFYSYDDCHIDLGRLAAFAKARLIHAEAHGIDTQASVQRQAGRPWQPGQLLAAASVLAGPPPSDRCPLTRSPVRCRHAPGIRCCQARRVLLPSRPAVAYDVLSIDVGISPAAAAVPGAAAHTTPVKPIDKCVTMWLLHGCMSCCVHACTRSTHVKLLLLLLHAAAPAGLWPALMR